VHNKGMALLMTLLVVTLLSVLILGMHSRSLLALTKAKNSVNSLNASYIMRSGVSAAMGFLERDARETPIDTLSEAWAHEVVHFPVGEGTVSIRIGDEASRFNINTLVTPQGKINDKAVERFGRLLRSVGSTEALSGTVAEWLRSNRKRLSYTFRDASELLLVPGVGSETVNRVEKYVTVYTNRMNERNININTVGREVLLALSPQLNEALVEGIMGHRRATPFQEIGEVKKVQGINDEILSTFSDVIDVRSSSFSVWAEAKVADVVRRGSALVGRDGEKVRLVAWKEE
jgi:general secretion pathway protein K